MMILFIKYSSGDKMKAVEMTERMGIEGLGGGGNKCILLFAGLT